MFNTRSAVWNSNGIHLNTALVNGVACTGTSGHVYPLGSTLIVVDKDSSGNYTAPVLERWLACTAGTGGGATC